jgi:hypothetical protein
MPELPEQPLPALAEEGKMRFDHERFDVYQTALAFREFADSLRTSSRQGDALAHCCDAGVARSLETR